MKKDIGIEFRKEDTLKIDSLPEYLYEGTKKQWSQQGIYISAELIDELTNIVEQYLRVMGLDSTIFPARVDLGFSEDMKPVIFEITTGFVDQVGSCLVLQESIGCNLGKEALSETPFDSTVLTSNPYRLEYDLMKEMFQRSGIQLGEQGEKTFVYGYPRQDMIGDSRYIPGWKGMNAEEKGVQSRIISRLTDKSSYVSPRVFLPNSVTYDDLPNESDTRLIFKQDMPKIKGDRNTVIFGKGKQAKERYDDGEMIAQEFIPPYRDMQGTRFESKVLFMPSKQGINFTGLYLLEDENEVPKNFGNTNIPNDGYPQGPGIVIS